MVGDGVEDFSGVASKAAVEVAEVLSEDDVFDDGEATVGEVFVGGHAGLEGFFSGANAVAEHDVAESGLHEAEEVGDESAVVLVIGVQHDDGVGVSFAGGVVTGFLVGAVAAVFLVLDDGESE